MAQRQNYGFQKRQKDLEKQKKKDEKAEKKRARKGAADDAASTDGGEEAKEDPDPPEPPPGGAEAQEESDPSEPRIGGAELDPELRARLQALCEEGWSLWERFDIQVRQHAFHPFVAADYPAVLEAMIPLRGPGLKFLEWGSATGVITIMADLLGFEAYGIEIDRDLVDQARDLARRTGSKARFTVGSFLPTGYRWRHRGDERLGTIESGDSGYLALGMPLEEFDLVFGYPWAGEEPMMHDLMRVHGRPDARFLVHTGDGVKAYRGGRLTE